MLDSARRSIELDRAREIRPLIDTVDVLFDLHSMLWPSDPLILCGTSPKGRRLALGAGMPALVVADHGHASGQRLIDYARFADAATPCAASLVEAGQHWQDSDGRDHVRQRRRAAAPSGHGRPTSGAAASLSHSQQRFAEVTLVVTAGTSNFAFVQPYRGGDVIPRRNTLIALDGETEIRTPLRRLPAGHAELAAKPRPHGCSTGAVHRRDVEPGPITSGSPGTGILPNPVMIAVTSSIAASAAAGSVPFATIATPLPLGR